MASDLSAYLRGLRKRGYEVTLTAGGHWQIRDQGKVIAHAPGTGGKGRGYLNLQAEVRRYEKGRGK